MVFQQMKSHATDRLMAERPTTGGHVTLSLTTSIKLNPGVLSFISGLQERWVILMNHAHCWFDMKQNPFSFFCSVIRHLVCSINQYPISSDQMWHLTNIYTPTPTTWIKRDSLHFISLYIHSIHSSAVPSFKVIYLCVIWFKKNDMSNKICRYNTEKRPTLEQFV